MGQRVHPPRSGYQGVCSTCGKNNYEDKKAAKAARKRAHPNDRMDTYRCGRYWHYGHPIMTREQYREREARRDPSREPEGFAPAGWDRQ
jgi:hypothetical protein